MDQKVEQISMTEASARGIARLAREAADGRPVAVSRHKRAIAVVLGLEEYRQLLDRATEGARRQSIPSPTQG